MLVSVSKSNNNNNNANNNTAHNKIILQSVKIEENIINSEIIEGKSILSSFVKIYKHEFTVEALVKKKSYEIKKTYKQLQHLLRKLSKRHLRKVIEVLLHSSRATWLWEITAFFTNKFVSVCVCEFLVAYVQITYVCLSTNCLLWMAYWLSEYDMISLTKHQIVVKSQNVITTKQKQVGDEYEGKYLVRVVS